MGRNAKPTALHIAEGNPNRLTKAELEARKAAEIKLGLVDLEKISPPSFVQNDAVAFKYWKQHIKEYKQAAKQGIEILTTADVGVLAMYCKTYSEYEALLKKKQIFDLNYSDSPLSVDDYIKIETAINKKMDMLIKMQDRLFLNPLSKVKNVPKQAKEKPQNPMEDEFGI